MQRYIEKALPEEEGQLIAIQILEALDFMHERNFTHRDLKPAVRASHIREYALPS